MFPLDMLRAVTDERERQIRAELRRRGLIPPPYSWMRVHHRPARPRPEAR